MTDRADVECRVPIRVKLTGRLTDDDLARLEAAVAEAVARSLRERARASEGR